MGIIGCFMDNTSGTNYTSTINQLKSITTVTADSDSYHFKNGNYWTITYSDVNEFAKIHESLITQSLSDWFGTKNLGCDSSLTILATKALFQLLIMILVTMNSF